MDNKLLKNKMMKCGKVFTEILAFVVSGICSLIFFSIRWALQTWSYLTMDELIYHLRAPLVGTGGDMIEAYMNHCVAPSVLVLIAILLLIIVVRKKEKSFIIMLAIIIVSLGFLVASIIRAWTSLDVGSYAKSQGTYSNFIDDEYINPKDVELVFPETKRNLIYIFLESMETTYADKENGGGFSQNYIPELTELAHENEDFSGDSAELTGGYSMPGTTWTIGAMVGQSSGLPLVSEVQNDMDTQESFYPGVITLGDILNQAGYSQTLLIGSDAEFGGRKLYYTEHGNYSIKDYNYALNTGEIPADYRVWWGYEDDKMFSNAKRELRELSQQDQPFNLTILTADTHFEDGYVCDLCSTKYKDNQYANVIACSSRQVESFVKWVQYQPFYENTTIVLVGDHPTMDSDFCEDVSLDNSRRVYTCIINPAETVSEREERNYTTFDMFPTTLASLGVQIEGERLGLGTNLFSSEETVTERVGIEYEEQELSKKSKMLNELIAFDNSSEKLLIKRGEALTGVIMAGEYDPVEGAIPVSVSNIVNADNGIENVQIAVWKEDSQQDLSWIQTEAVDNYYFGVINTKSFASETGEYHIAGYLIDSNGEQQKIAETSLRVE